jgi:PAS domain S-box-containing protein
MKTVIRNKSLWSAFGDNLHKWPLLLVTFINFIIISVQAFEYFQGFYGQDRLLISVRAALIAVLSYSLLNINKIYSMQKPSYSIGLIASFLSIFLLYLKPEFLALILLIASVSVLLLESKKSWAIHLSLMLSVFLGFSGLLITSSYSFDVDLFNLFPFGENQNIVFLTFGYSMMLFSVSIAASTLGDGPLSFLDGNTRGAIFARRLVLTAAIAPTTIDMIMRFGLSYGIYEPSTKSALSSILCISILIISVMFTLKALHVEETIRIMSENRYRELNKKFQNLIDTAPDPIFSIGSNGVLKFVNTQALKFLGYRSEELIGRPAAILIPDQLKSYYIDFLHQFKIHPKRTTLGIDQEIFILKKDGSLSPVEVSINPCVDGGSSSATCIVRDLTSQKEILQKLEDSQTRLNLVLENLPLGIWFTDEQGKIVFGNRASYEIWGVKLENQGEDLVDLRGKLKSGEEVLLHGGALRKCIHSRESILNQVVDIVGRDGKKRTISNSVVPILDKRGIRHGAISVNEDITQEITRKIRIELMNKLARRLTHFTDDDSAAWQLVHAAVPGFADWCAVSYFDGKMFTPAAHLHKDQHKAKALEDVVLGNRDFKWKLLEMIKAIESDEALLYATVDRSKYAELDLAPDYLEKLRVLGTSSYIMSPIIEKGNPIGVVFFGIVENSFGRKYGKEDLQYASDLCKLFALSVTNSRLFKKAKTAVKAREDILAIVAHDIKGPLSTMLLAAEMIEKVTVENAEISSLIKKYTKISQASGGRTLKLIQDLLDFAQMDNRTFTVRKTKNKIKDFTDPVIQEYGIQMESKSIKFVKNLKANDLEILCDKDRIIQVIANILNNAVKFTPLGGTIEVSSERMDNEVEISIRDSGPGVSKEYLSTMFERFWQEKETASLGNGLGLSIAKGIVQAHNGKIWAESDFGKGCTVRFRIPLGDYYKDSLYLITDRSHFAS